MLEYTKIGADYSATEQHRAALDAAIASLEWHTLPCEGPFMQMEGLREIMFNYRIAPVMGVSWDALGHPYADGLGLLALKTRKQAFYFVDHGDGVCPVALEGKR